MTPEGLWRTAPGIPPTAERTATPAGGELMSTALPLSDPSAPAPLHAAVRRPVAPWWHTALLAALFLGLAAGGAAFQKAAGAHPGLAQRPPQVVQIYLSMLIAEWGLLLYVWRAGLRRGSTTLTALIGGRWSSWRDFVRDLGLAVVLCAGAMIVMSGVERLLGHGHEASIEGFLPRHALEVTLWVLLSLTAGFVEEAVFRGYFQRQFEAWTRSPWIALLLQAALFAVSHGYQGTRACSKIAVFGVLYGLVALWRRSLRPGMIAHALTDIVGGIVRI